MKRMTRRVALREVDENPLFNLAEMSEAEILMKLEVELISLKKRQQEIEDTLRKKGRML